MKKFRYIECPNCGILNDRRYNFCTDCNYAIKQNRIPRPPANSIEVNWEDLSVGEEVYIICPDIWISENGIPVIVGDSGNFKIVKILIEGILGYSTDIGYAFFNMVWAGTKSQCNIVRKQTKVYRLGNKVRTNR